MSFSVCSRKYKTNMVKKSMVENFCSHIKSSDGCAQQWASAEIFPVGVKPTFCSYFSGW